MTMTWKVECPDCGGSGSVDETCTCSACGDDHETSNDCENCNGRGEVEVVKA